MRSRPGIRIARAASVSLAVAFGQQAGRQPSPRFEVVSIHAVPANAAPIMLDIFFSPVSPQGRYVHPRVGLPELLSFAYNMQLKFWRQLAGLPNWAMNQSYSISAKPAENFPDLPAAQNVEQVRLMRAVLADRFHVKVHTEMRKAKVYIMELMKGGLKIKEVPPPVPPAREGYVGLAAGDATGHMLGKKTTMEGLAKALTVFFEKPVIDQTGLRGYYDIDENWNSSDVQATDSQFGVDGASLLISVLRDRFGVRLTSATSPLPYCIVDHVEPPTEN